MYEILLYEEGLRMAMDEKIKTSDELEFAVFCIENVAAKLVRDGVSDMHCMSDAYLAEELKQEYEEKVPEKAVVKERIK